MYHFSSRFSPYLTSYDFLKFFAVVTMLIDHVGFFFFPDQPWLRAIGRLSFPCWMFLVGFANTRAVPKMLVGGCLALVGVNFVLGQYILPLNILALIILMRLVLTPLAQVVFKSKEGLFYAFLLILILGLPLVSYVEYSTFGILMVLFGFAVRHRGETCLGFWSERIFSAGVVLVCVVGQVVPFHLLNWMGVGYGLAMVGLGVVLFHFSAQEFIEFTQKFPKPAVWILQFCGRYSLEIYVVHVIVFYLAAIYLGIKDLRWFDPDLFYR